MKHFSLDDTEDHISERAVSDGARIVPAGTVFIVVRGMILAHTFPVCIAERSMSFNQDVKALVPQPGVEGRFLAHWLHGNRNKLLGLVTEATHGTKRLDLHDLQTTAVLLPAPSEQRCIAEILDTLEEAIRKTEQLIAKLKQVKEGLLQVLLSRGIDNNGELRDPYRHPEQFKDSPLGPIPSEWRLRSVSELAEKVVDGTHFTPTYTEHGVPFLRVTDLHQQTIDPTRTKHIPEREHQTLISRCDPRAGDVLLSKNGTVGIARVVDWNWSFSIFVSLAQIRPRRELINGDYLELVLNSSFVADQIRRRSKQATVTNLHLEEIREFVIPVPQASEQTALADRARAMDATVFAEVAILKKLLLLKDGLIEDLLSGRVRVANLLNEVAA